VSEGRKLKLAWLGRGKQVSEEGRRGGGEEMRRCVGEEGRRCACLAVGRKARIL